MVAAVGLSAVFVVCVANLPPIPVYEESLGEPLCREKCSPGTVAGSRSVGHKHIECLCRDENGEIYEFPWTLEFNWSKQMREMRQWQKSR